MEPRWGSGCAVAFYSRGAKNQHPGLCCETPSAYVKPLKASCKFQMVAVHTPTVFKKKTKDSAQFLRTYAYIIINAAGV